MPPAGCLQRNHHRAAAALGIGHTPDADARFYYRCVRTHIKKRAKNSNLQFKKRQQRREDGSRIKRQEEICSRAKGLGRRRSIDRRGVVVFGARRVCAYATHVRIIFRLRFDCAGAHIRTRGKETRRRRPRLSLRSRTHGAFSRIHQMHQHTTTKKRTLPCSAMHILSLGFLECAQFSGCVVYVNMRAHIFCN